ncbi:MAG: 3-keto-5-aminohexanoate cleavage protein [Deltaproteobacteria bacterium]|nr:3-keto-5-aminohexanoate cleavage protein [Deltaproteobacteria bacterium]
MSAEYMWDFSNSYQYMEKVRKGMPPLIITVAITGGMHGKEANPNLPEAPEEQVEQTYESYQAGASIVHVHARRADNRSLVSSNPDDYRLINRMIRAKCPDIIINNTTGGGPGMTSEQRMASLYANPELASLNCGPFIFQTTLKARVPPLSGRPENMFVDTCIPVSYAETELYAKTMKENGIKPELEVYNQGQFWLVNNLIAKKLLGPPYMVQFVMGFQSGTYPTPKNLLNMIEHLPPDSMFQCIGVGPFQIPMTLMGMMMGGHVRVGMEDNVYLEKKKLARSNAEFVERVVRLAKEIGREIATPMVARKMLGISENPSRYE